MVSPIQLVDIIFCIIGAIFFLGAMREKGNYNEPVLAFFGSVCAIILIIIHLLVQFIK